MSDRENGERSRMNRRRFLKSGSLGAGAAVALTGCGGDEKLIPFLIPEENIIPGVDQWTTSTCAVCPAGCGILVRSAPGEARVLREGQERRQTVLQVKKIEGNPDHVVNRGRLCARGQAGPQILYNPDRIRTPLKISGPRGSGQYLPISWDEGLSLLERKLEPLRASGAASGLAAIVGHSSVRRQSLMSEFLRALGSQRCYREEPLGTPVLREANRRVFGRQELEVHDLENAHYILSFGADILGAHTSPVRYNLGLGHFRQGRPGERGKFVQIEGRFSLTAANADEWLPARPGTEGEVALALAHVILKEEIFDKESVKSINGFEAFRQWVLKKYAPEDVAEALDVPAKRIARVAREFARHQPGLALTGGAAVAHPYGLFTAGAVHSLNALVGNPGKRGGILWTASSRKRAAPVPAPARQWAEDLVSAPGSIQVLILWDANPAYRAPASAGALESLEKTPFIAAFSSFMNDSTAYADLILPDRTFLERYDVVEPEVTAGTRVVSLVQPIVTSMYESRDCADVVLGLARKWGGKTGAALPDSDFREYLKRNLGAEDVLNHGSFSAEDMDSFWSALKGKGVWVDDATDKARVTVDLTFLPGAEPLPPAERESAEYPFSLQPFASLALGEGNTANLPWMQELPDPMTSIVWGTWIEMNPRTAVEFGIEHGELVWLESASGKIEAPVFLTPAARPDVVSIPFGHGHRFYGRYARSRGVNPWEIIVPRSVKDTGEPAWAATRVKVIKTGQKARVIQLGQDRGHTPEELHR